MKISLIAALGKNRVIGKDNDLIWHLPADMKFFKETTIGHFVLMGRKNYESIPEKYRPLADRTNLIITRDTTYEAEGSHVFHSIDDALKFARSQNVEELFIIGGANIYAQLIDEADQLYITHIDGEFEGDVFFPEIDMEKWEIISKKDRSLDERNPYNMSFCTYIRKEGLIN